MNCHLVVGIEERTEICDQCAEYRQILLVLNRRQQVKVPTTSLRTLASSHTNYRYLSSPEKTERLKQLHHQNRIFTMQMSRLKLKLEKVIYQRGVTVDDDMSTDLCTIMKEEQQHVEKEFPQGSFQRIFWDQQREVTTKRDPRGMRWHPLMIKFCLYLRHQSSKAYETIRQSGCVSLPSQRTLRDYSNAVKAVPGFSSEVDHQLKAAARVSTSKEWEKLVTLLLDEMYIKEDLVYEKHEGILVGFVNLGSVNDHLLAFELSINAGTDDESCALAKSVMTFMVRGLFTSLRYPYVHFLCSSVTGDLLFQPFWEAVYRLERMGLKVYLLVYMYMYNCCYNAFLVRFCVLHLIGRVPTGVWSSCMTRVPGCCTKCPTFMLKMEESYSLSQMFLI